MIRAQLSASVDTFNVSFVATLHLRLASPEMLILKVVTCAQNIEQCWIPPATLPHPQLLVWDLK